jgi:hypothetical protein
MFLLYRCNAVIMREFIFRSIRVIDAHGQSMERGVEYVLT